MKQGEVAESDKQKVLAYSVECSDEYGDVIHLARAMANTYDNTYFDMYDGCLQASDQRSSKESNASDKIDIYPNPTLGQVYLQLPVHYYGQAEVYSIDGSLISSTPITDSNISVLDISSGSGVNYIHLRSKSGEVVTKKIIVLK